jgi:hypothetical protein
MSEKPQAKPVTKEPKKETKNEVVKAQDHQVKREKEVWTLEKCMQHARRYQSEALWASDAPASYKSAVAHGWKDSCLAEMNKTGKVVPGNFNKGGKNSNDKKAA